MGLQCSFEALSRTDNLLFGTQRAEWHSDISVEQTNKDLVKSQHSFSLLTRLHCKQNANALVLFRTNYFLN